MFKRSGGCTGFVPKYFRKDLSSINSTLICCFVLTSLSFPGIFLCLPKSFLIVPSLSESFKLFLSFSRSLFMYTSLCLLCLSECLGVLLCLFYSFPNYFEICFWSFRVFFKPLCESPRLFSLF